MNQQEAFEEYSQALRLGLREHKTLDAAGKNPYPAVLDEILADLPSCSVQEIGLLEIPAERIIGIKSKGRIAAFSASFLPLLDVNSEFALKWISLCRSHMDEEGIRDPILCYEYLGNFYVQEGNKRVSVLRYFGAPRILATVIRVNPPVSDDPRIKAYQEFTEFFKSANLYQVQFRRPGDYAQLLSFVGKDPGEPWSEQERRTFTAYFQYFCDAFFAQGGKNLDLLPEEALLIWLQIHPFQLLGELSASELKASVAALWEDLVALSQPEPVEVRLEESAQPERPGLISRILSGTPDHLHVAFIHPMDLQSSTWVQGHEQGRAFLEEVLENKITTESYFHADSPEQAEALLEQAVEEGADVIFTTTPQLSRPTLKMAVKYPRVRFLNCSVDTPYSSLRTYYCRIYEAKFITGAIAGAMADNDQIGYIGSSPIFGVPASINAFALGAQLTNPRAKIHLRWSCQAGMPQSDFLRDGIFVISNRDVPTQDQNYLNFCNYGTYFQDENGILVPLASPVWLWGKFYEKVIQSILNGTFDKDKASPRALNYWWGFGSGVIDVELSNQIPEGSVALAALLREGLRSGAIDPFRRKIVAQDGSVKNDGTQTFTPDVLLHMDWLCDNVIGSIPQFHELEPYAQSMVRELGIYRDQIPLEKEGSV